MKQSQPFYPRFSIVGLGKLGAPMLAAMAKRGFEVIGVDINPHSVEAINAGYSPVQETGVAEAIAANRSRIRATLSYEEAVLNSDLTFVIVPTPSDENGRLLLDFAAAVFDSIGRVLGKKDDYHIVVLTSTVLPGSTRYGLIPVIEQASGKKAGGDFGVCYNPALIALGSVMRDFLNPDLFIIGESDERAGAYLARCYELLRENDAACVRTTFENAELIKIALNNYIVMKITFANLLGALCEQLPGGDVDTVTRAIGLDARIGNKYLRAGLGFGGPCFPRDTHAMAFAEKMLGFPMGFSELVDRINQSWPDRVMDKLRPALSASATVALLGLAYKPHTPVLEKSQSMDLARLLLESGVKKLIAYDPLANHEARTLLGAGVTFANSAQECVADADVVIISTSAPAFRALRASDFKKVDSRPVLVFDCWRLLRAELASQPRIDYRGLGLGVGDDSNEARLRAAWGLPALQFAGTAGAPASA